MYPEYKYVFCGDDGQGDLLAGELMTKYYPDTVLAVFIHRVVHKGKALHTQVLKTKGETLLGETLVPPLEAPLSWNDLSATVWPKNNIYVTETYIKSASIACTLGLITPTELYDCCISAVDEFDDIRCMYPDRGADWSEAEKDLDYDIIDANEVLTVHGWSGKGVRVVTKTQVLFGNMGRQSEQRTRRVSLGNKTEGAKVGLVPGAGDAKPKRKRQSVTGIMGVKGIPSPKASEKGAEGGDGGDDNFI